MDLPWTTPVDPLGEALHFLRMSGTFYCRSELTAPWGLEMPAFGDCLSFHAVTSGGCWLELPGTAPVALSVGDLALVPHGRGHLLRNEPSAPLLGRVDKLPQEEISERYTVLRLGGGGPPTLLVCGIVQFDHPAAGRLLPLLPPILHVQRPPERMQRTLALLAEEAQTLQPGGEAVLTRLADILVIQALRTWMQHDPAARTGWLGALQDEQIGRALMRVHREPAHPWTLESMARAAAMSRSAFAARFTALVGEPAMQYVVRWRMALAKAWLLESDETLGVLAARVGYQSEAAFSRAFKRYIGVSPGAVRRGREVEG